MTTRCIHLFRSDCFLTCAMALLLCGGCERRAPSQAEGESNRKIALLLAQAQFMEERTPAGNSRVIPGPAKLTIVYPNARQWSPEVLEDPDSNVFHKAMPFAIPGERPGILTIGGNKAPRPALLKVWRQSKDGWKGTILWEATFGGKFNRLRDVEIGDVTGDNRPEIVIATHDQGVVAVLRKEGEAWTATAIDEAPGLFVHEIEIGDVDGDGRNEIFATPSAPNKIDGTPQPGWIVMYRCDGKEFSRHSVEQFPSRHVKEILVANVAGTGRPNLYVALEGQLGRSTATEDNGDYVEIREYRFTGADCVGTTIATLPDKQCRFLNAGDVDNDGKVELVASAFKSGLWIIEPEGETWTTNLIDEDSSGYEHATMLANMDGDGALEIYVAADDQQRLRRYRWTGARFERTDLCKLTKGDITFGCMPCLNAKCLGVR